MGNAPFLAYDKVPYTQYDLYVEYATLTPGTAVAARLASNLLRAAWAGKDETVRELYDNLRKITDKNDLVPLEYTLFAIRDVSGDNFDIYFVDEDQIFLTSALGVAEEDVIAVGQSLVQHVHDNVLYYHPSNAQNRSINIMNHSH